MLAGTYWKPGWDFSGRARKRGKLDGDNAPVRRRGEFDGVGHEIDQDLENAARVDGHPIQGELVVRWVQHPPRP